MDTWHADLESAAEEGIGPDWLLSDHAGPLSPDPGTVEEARAFVLARWRERAAERGEPEPADLSRACKFNVLFVKALFGGVVRGNEEHVFNEVDGRRIDLSEGAADVLGLDDPYLDDPAFIQGDPCFCDSLDSCVPRVRAWADAFLAERLPGPPGP